MNAEHTERAGCADIARALADAAEAAEESGAADAPICLTSSAAVARDIKKHCPADRPLPLILPTSALFAAGEVLPADKTLLAAIAALDGIANERPRQLLWQIYDTLRPHCGDAYGAPARLQLAGKLADLFIECDEHSARDTLHNPFAALDAPSYESGVAGAVWEELREDKNCPLNRQALFEQLARMLPPALAVIDDDTTPAARAFYEQCNARMFTLAPNEDEHAQQWQQFFSAEGAPDDVARAMENALADDYEISRGIGDTLSDAAQIALDEITRRLAGLPADETLGVIVYDRALARRLRALAEGRKIYIADKGGWRADSLAYGAALLRYATALLGAFDLAAVGALLAPPFYNSRAASGARNWHRLLDNTLALPTNFDELVTALAKTQGDQTTTLMYCLSDLQTTARAMPENQPAAAWWQWLSQSGGGDNDNSEDNNAALAAWQNDRVAEALNNRLTTLAAQFKMNLTGEEFLLWLTEIMESETITDESVNSRVTYATPNAAGTYSALLLLGLADTGRNSANRWLGEREREQLRLPLRIDSLREERRQFARLFAAHKKISAVWCKKNAAGEWQKPSPFWQVVEDALARKKNPPRELRPAPDITCHPSVSLPPPPAPAITNASALPATLRITAANALMTCPYQFYVYSILGLGDTEAPDTSDMHPRLTGTLLHKVMERFSAKSDGVKSLSKLRRHWRDSVNETLSGNRPGIALQKTYWLEHGEKFIAWELEQREIGWRVVATEEKIEEEVSLGKGKNRATLTLSGRIDRIDEYQDAQGKSNATRQRIIDYKTGALPARKKVEAGEHPQLPLYSALAAKSRRQDGDAMLCRPLHRDDKIRTVEIDSTTARRIARKLRRVMRDIAAGAALPANGAATSCDGCGAREVCRRDHWAA